MPGSLSLLLALTTAASMQTPQAPSPNGPAVRRAPPELRAERVTGTLAVDGKLDEADWLRAQPAIQFTQTDPVEGQPATERTEVRVLIDDGALDVGARLYDSSHRRVKTVLAPRGDAGEGGGVDLFLHTFP